MSIYADMPPEKLRLLLGAPHVDGRAKAKIREALAGTTDAPPAPEPVRPLTLHLPLPPFNRSNARPAHWSERHRADAYYHAACTALLELGALPAPPAVAWQRIRLEVRMYVWAEHDDENAMVRCKPAIDWLVRAGYVANDRRENIERGVPEQVIDRERQGLVLRVAPPASS